MKSARAKNLIERNSTEDCFDRAMVEDSVAVAAVELAEEDMRNSAISAFQETCGYYENGKCSGSYAAVDGSCEMICGGGSRFIHKLDDKV